MKQVRINIYIYIYTYSINMESKGGNISNVISEEVKYNVVFEYVDPEGRLVASEI